MNLILILFVNLILYLVNLILYLLLLLLSPFKVFDLNFFFIAQHP